MDGLKVLRTSLTSDAAASILETACGSCGIGYWATLVECKRDSTEATDLEWILIEDEEGRVKGQRPRRFKITRAKIAKAVDAILKDPTATEALGSAEKIMSYDTADGPLADCIVQVACYGKVVYG